MDSLSTEPGLSRAPDPVERPSGGPVERRRRHSSCGPRDDRVPLIPGA